MMYFAILYYASVSDMMRSSTDPESGQPGLWSEIVGGSGAEIVNVCPLPLFKDETGFRILVTYRMPEPDVCVNTHTPEPCRHDCVPGTCYGRSAYPPEVKGDDDPVTVRLMIATTAGFPVVDQVQTVPSYPGRTRHHGEFITDQSHSTSPWYWSVEINHHAKGMRA